MPAPHTSTFLKACRALTACGLTGLALMAGNVIKTGNIFSPRILKGQISSQVRVETVDLYKKDVPT
jgi:hypothetical protein